MNRGIRKLNGSLHNDSIFQRREVFTLFLLVAVVLISLLISPNFRDLGYILKSATRYMEYGFVALMVTLVIISGQIDLSIAACMACVATFTGLMYRAGIPMELSLILGLLSGFVLGSLNGVLVAYVGLPSMIVTIGTMPLFRGISQIFIGDKSIGKFPDWFNSLDKIAFMRIGDTVIPLTLVCFLVVALIFYVILHKTALGRKIYALGINEDATVYSGVKTKRLKFFLFAFTSFFAGLAGILTMSRLLVVRYDMATGGELDIITIVLLGGTDINGGRGSMLGTALAVFIIIFLRSGLMVANVRAQDQMFLLGILLLISVVLPNVYERIRNKRLEK